MIVGNLTNLSKSVYLSAQQWVFFDIRGQLRAISEYEYERRSEKMGGFNHNK